MKTMLSTAVFLLLLVMMVSPLNAQEPEGTPVGTNAVGTNACATGWTKWVRPIREAQQQSTTTWAYLTSGLNHWVWSDNEKIGTAIINCASSAHFCRFHITSCNAKGQGAINNVRLWNS